MNKTILIEGMMCGRCKKHVEDALMSLGVSPIVSLEEKKAQVNTDLEDGKLIEAIENAGYDVKEIIHE